MQLNLLNKPYNILLIGAVLSLLCSFAIRSQTIELNIFDTYYIVSAQLVNRIAAASLILFWVVYYLTRSVALNKKLSWIHVIFTLAAFSIVIAIPLFKFLAYGAGSETTWRSYEELQWESKLMMFSLLLLLLGLLLFVINFTVGLLTAKTYPK